MLSFGHRVTSEKRCISFRSLSVNVLYSSLSSKMLRGLLNLSEKSFSVSPHNEDMFSNVSSPGQYSPRSILDKACFEIPIFLPNSDWFSPVRWRASLIFLPNTSLSNIIRTPYIEIIKQEGVFWDKSNDKQDIENNGNI